MSQLSEQDPTVLAGFKWSKSIVADVLRRHYPEQIPDGSSKERLLSLHLYFWRVLVFGSEALSRRQRHTLVAAAFEAGLNSDFLSGVDAEVMTELLEVILRRYRATPLDARRYHLLLLSVAARLRLSDLPDPADSNRPGHFEAAGSRWYR